jgi:hypothetical protein
MRSRPVVVTDLREPLVVLHRRLIRRRTVLMVVWILGWAATGFVSDTAWLALTILAVTGPLLWLAVWAYFSCTAPGRREQVGRQPAGRRAITATAVRRAGPGPAGPDGAAGR